MKRSEIQEFILDELMQLVADYPTVSEKRKPYFMRNRANGILDMLEGFGMLPPSKRVFIRYDGNEQLQIIKDTMSSFAWDEDEKD